MFKLILAYIVFIFESRSGRGHGVHSPFVFDFTQQVLSNFSSQAALKRILAHTQTLANLEFTVSNSALGAGRPAKGAPRPIGKVIAREAVPPKYGRLLYHLAQWNASQYIVELGTSVGVSTLYLASSAERGQIITIEGDAARSRIALENFTRFGVRNVKMVQGLFSEVLPKVLAEIPQVDLVFFDGDHRLEATISNFEACLSKAHEGSVFVFDDIRWSSDMQVAWKRIANDPRVSVSIDLFRMGLVFFRRGINKQYFKIFY